MLPQITSGDKSTKQARFPSSTPATCSLESRRPECQGEREHIYVICQNICAKAGSRPALGQTFSASCT